MKLTIMGRVWSLTPTGFRIAFFEPALSHPQISAIVMHVPKSERKYLLMHVVLVFPLLIHNNHVVSIPKYR